MIRPTCSWCNGSLLTRSTSVRSLSITPSAASKSEELPSSTRHAGGRSCELHLGKHLQSTSVVRIGEIGDARHCWDCLAQELQSFGAEVGTKHGVAGDIAARAGKARHQAHTHWIADADHYDRDRRRRSLGRFDRRRAVCRDQVDRAPDELAHRRGEAVRHSLAVAVFIVDALALDIAELAQRLAEAMPHRRVVNDANARYTRRLLRVCRNRPRGRRAAEQRDELAPVDHSITSSARASNDAGTSRPSAFAVFRLITVSYLVGLCTGRSAGFSPLRMRST